MKGKHADRCALFGGWRGELTNGWRFRENKTGNKGVFFFQPTTRVGTRQPGRDDDHDGAGSCGAVIAGGAADVKQLFSDPLFGAFRATPNILAASISRVLSRRSLPPLVNVAPLIRRRPKAHGRSFSAVQFGWSRRTTHVAAARRVETVTHESRRRRRLTRSQIVGLRFSCCRASFPPGLPQRSHFALVRPVFPIFFFFFYNCHLKTHSKSSFQASPEAFLFIRLQVGQ